MSAIVGLSRSQLLPSGFSPQPLLAAWPFVERHGLQLVHDPRARLHHAVPVRQQLPQITILPARYPDLRKVILQHPSQNQLRQETPILSFILSRSVPRTKASH
jgi:hypothetical protein